MQIDDYGQAIALKEKLEAALPFRVRPGKQLMRAIEDKSITPMTWLEVDTVMYAGDEGGILLSLQPGREGKAVYATSLTHVVFDPEHDLALEVKEYQRQRTRKLMLQNQKGFAAELLAKKALRKRKPKKKGFGS